MSEMGDFLESKVVSIDWVFRCQVNRMRDEIKSNPAMSEVYDASIKEFEAFTRRIAELSRAKIINKTS